MKRPSPLCIKCGRTTGTLVVDERRGVQVRCSCGHSWRPRKPVERPRQGRAVAA